MKEMSREVASQRLAEIVTGEPEKFCRAIADYVAEQIGIEMGRIRRQGEVLNNLIDKFEKHLHAEGQVVVPVVESVRGLQKLHCNPSTPDVRRIVGRLRKEGEMDGLEEIKHLMHVLEGPRAEMQESDMGQAQMAESQE